MPLSEKQVLELKCVGTPGAPVDQVVLKWPSAPDGAFFLGVPFPGLLNSLYCLDT